VQLDRLNQDQLRTLQTRLQELGFYQGPVDGVLGEGTRSSLRQFFQTQAELASRGIITDATVSLFGVAPQGLNPPQGNLQHTSTRQPNTPQPTNPSQGIR
jgi:peptidoglycan hydrolase-like protein with peptidoglycan-binding domain